MKILLIILSLCLFSCKKENCSCGEVLAKEELNIVVSNVCSKKVNKFYVNLYESHLYNIGQTYCNDKNFTW